MRIKLAFILLTGTMIVSAQESEVLLKNYTLRQCIDYAIEHNITVRQSANEVEQSAVEVSSAKWARLPSLNGSAGENWAWGRSGVTEKTLMEKNFRYIKIHTITVQTYHSPPASHCLQVSNYLINMRLPN